MISMADLFQKDPRKMTDEEFRRIVTECREQRQRFVLEGKPTASLKDTTGAKTLASTLKIGL